MSLPYARCGSIGCPGDDRFGEFRGNCLLLGNALASLAGEKQTIVVASDDVPALIYEGTQSMSWDLFVQDLPRGISSIKEIPNNFRPAPIGKRQRVLDAIADLAPFADRSDPSWVTIEAPGISIEVSLGADEDLSSFAFHIRGGQESIDLVAAILERLGLRALDGGSTTGIFDPTTASASLESWRKSRDRLLK